MKNRSSLTLLIIIANLVFYLLGCRKYNPPACEKWEVKDERFNVGGCIDWSCSGRNTLSLNFCGEALKDAKAGNTITLSEDNCCKKTRTFVRLIE